jgi:regulator of protease activity HflC (stomatin/prohibitin superfamily)
MIHGKKRNGDLFKRLTESWGYTNSNNTEEEVTPLDEEMAADTETVTEEEHEDDDKEVKAEGSYGKHGEKDEDDPMEEGVFDANHYCIHHGGVHHNGSIEMAEAIQHVKPNAKGHISHYDMKLADGTILENVAAEDIQVTNASLAQEHTMKRNAPHAAMKDAPAEEEEEEDKVEERARGRQRAASPDPARDDDRTRPMEEAEKDDEDVVKEAETEDDSLEEAIRRVVIEAINKIKADK